MPMTNSSIKHRQPPGLGMDNSDPLLVLLRKYLYEETARAMFKEGLPLREEGRDPIQRENSDYRRRRWNYKEELDMLIRQEGITATRGKNPYR